MADGQKDDDAAPSPTRFRRPIWLAALAAAVTFIAAFGVWRGQVNQQEALNEVTSPGGLFEREQSQGTSLTAVGRLTGLAKTCTGWVLATGGDDDAPAIAVTTARCVGFSDPASILTDQVVSGAILEVNDFARLTSAGEVNAVPVPVARILWASVRGTDLAVLELGATEGDLAGRGVAPITAVAMPDQGAEILIAGVPVGGVPEDQQYLRGSRCQLGATTDVLESSLLWPDARAVDCPGILEGSQGSAALNQAGEILAMVISSTIGAPEGPDCESGRPCEVTQAGAAVQADTSYVIPVDIVNGCFPKGSLALAGDCGLEDPAEVIPAVAAAPVGRPGSPIEVSLRGTSPDPDPKVKQGMLGAVDCRELEGWQAVEGGIADPAPQAEDPQWTYPVTLPTTEGRALVCVGSAAHPTEIVLVIDATPPDPASIELTQVEVAGGVEVGLVVEPPDLAAFRWVIAPPGSADCASVEGYVEYAGGPETIPAADLPATVCVVGIDQAGNESAPAAIRVE